MIYILLIILGLLLYLLLAILIMIMTLNYHSEDTSNYLWVDDYDYGIEPEIPTEDLVEEIVEDETPTLTIEPEEPIDISGIEEVYLPRLYCSTIHRDTDSEYHILSTPSYGYMREDIRIDEIGLKCRDGELWTIADISYNENEDVVKETITVCDNTWYKTKDSVPKPGTRGQVTVDKEGRVSLRVVWGTSDERKEIVNYKFTTRIPVEDRHVVWAVHVQSQKLHLVIATTPV